MDRELERILKGAGLLLSSYTIIIWGFICMIFLCSSYKSVLLLIVPIAFCCIVPSALLIYIIKNNKHPFG